MGDLPQPVIDPDRVFFHSKFPLEDKKKKKSVSSQVDRVDELRRRMGREFECKSGQMTEKSQAACQVNVSGRAWSVKHGKVNR